MQGMVRDECGKEIRGAITQALSPARVAAFPARSKSENLSAGGVAPLKMAREDGDADMPACQRKARGPGAGNAMCRNAATRFQLA